MSDRTSERMCGAVRSQTLNLLSGDVSALEQTRLRGHLDRCAACRSLFDEASAMMTAGREQRYLLGASAKEALFQQVMDRLEVEEAPPAPARSAVRRLFPWTAAAAAALAIAGLSYPLFVPHPETKRPPAELSRQTAPKSTPPTAAAAPELIAETAGPGLFLGKTAETKYFSERQGDARRLTVTQGTLWIRFKPTESIRTLTVVGPNVTVRVTGTVLMLSADPNGSDTVGVLRGHVRATPHGASEIHLGEGEAFTVGSERIDRLPAPQKEQAALWLAKLVDAVASRTCTDPEPEPEADAVAAAEPEISTPETPPDSAALYKEAEQLMARGAWAEAARRLERIVARSPGSNRADTARLDLSRIYAGRLGAPRRAARHLQAYLNRHPDTSEAPLLRRRLCTLLPKEDEDRPESCPD